MNTKNREVNPDYAAGTFVRDRMALSRFLQINTIPELVSRLSIFFNHRFYSNEDRLVQTELFEELTVQDILAVWMTWRHYRFPPVLNPYSLDSSLKPVSRQMRKRNQLPI
jgi:hypothetical protein